jgi:hypothetical protein
MCQLTAAATMAEDKEEALLPPFLGLDGRLAPPLAGLTPLLAAAVPLPLELCPDVVADRSLPPLLLLVLVFALPASNPLFLGLPATATLARRARLESLNGDPPATDDAPERPPTPPACPRLLAAAAGAGLVAGKWMRPPSPSSREPMVLPPAAPVTGHLSRDF